MRRIRLVAGIVLAAQLILAPAAMAAEDGSVTVQVTMDAPCILLGQSTLSPLLAQRFEAEIALGPVDIDPCNASGGQDIYVSATDAAAQSPGTATWTLGDLGATSCQAPATLDVFEVQSNVFASGDTPTSWTTLTTTPALLGSTTSPVAAYKAGVLVTLPCDGSSGAGEVMEFSIDFLATF